MAAGRMNVAQDKSGFSGSRGSGARPRHSNGSRDSGWVAMQRGWWMLMTVLLAALAADIGCRCAWSLWTGQPFAGPRPAACLPDDLAPLPESATPTASPTASVPFATALAGTVAALADRSPVEPARTDIATAESGSDSPGAIAPPGATQPPTAAISGSLSPTP